LTSCGDISRDDNYVLTSDLSSSGPCLTMHDFPNAQLSCQSHQITSTWDVTDGVITINNVNSVIFSSCVINGFIVTASTGMNLSFYGGDFEGTLEMNNQVIAQFSGNVFGGAGSQNCSNNPMLCNGGSGLSPVITSAVSTAAIVGASFVYTITAANTDPSTSFNASGLPVGLSINTSNGVISGVPTNAGTSVVTLTVTNVYGITNILLRITINPSGSAGVLSVNLSAVRIYPNPWRGDKHAGKVVTFDQLPLGATIKIFTVNGRLIKTLMPSATTATWDLTNNTEDKVGSGLYIYLISDNQGNKIRGKLAVIK